MKLLRRPFVSTLLAVCFAPAVLGCGGYDEEEPPTSLAVSLSRLPSKSLGQIVLETTPTGPQTPIPNFASEIDKIMQRIGKDAPADLLRAVDDLLAKARTNYENDSWCNVLEDARDVISASSADASAAQGYLRWRLQHVEWFQPPKDDGYSYPPKEPAVPPEENAELDLLIKTATGPIKAHWLFLRGALLYKQGDRQKCRQWFERVVKEYPDHPRAEVAQFLLARCDFSDSRSLDYSTAPEKLDAPRAKAMAAFEAFRRKYPNGRLDSDALGWLGALAYDSNDYASAMKYYIAQAENAAHPEVLKSAIFMCEKTLGALDQTQDNSAVYALIAQHPRVAMGYIYQVLGAGEPFSVDDGVDPNPTAVVKRWRRKVLPLIAAEVARQHDLYKSDDWQPRYLAMLALSASEAGDQAQALQITDVAAGQINKSDDLLFARAITLQRAKRAPEAIEDYRKLLELFPKSPLALGVHLRLALALQDNHQAGDALVELFHLCVEMNAAEQKGASFDSYEPYPPGDGQLQIADSAIASNISGADLDQIQQAIDTLLNFAPQTELATALESSAFDDASKSEIRAVIAERYLIEENFPEAKKYMTEAQYGLIAAKLEKLTNDAARANPGKEKAAKFALLGDAWDGARGQLLRLPLDSKMGGPLHLPGEDTRDYTYGDLLLRRDNGNACGFPDVDRELEDRDELRHASRWWMRAAREDAGSPLAAKSRWKALEAMPKIAAVSGFADELARETKAGEASRVIYDRLRIECPNSIEAKRYAAYWSFPEAPKDENSVVMMNASTYVSWGPNGIPIQSIAHKSWDEGDYLNVLGYLHSDFGAFGLEMPDSDWNNQRGDGWRDEITTRLDALPDYADQWDIKHFAAEVDDLTALARKRYQFPLEAEDLNFLDDLALFIHEPAVTPGILKAYLKFRTDVMWGVPPPPDGATVPIDTAENSDPAAGEIEKALKDPVLKPVQDYVEFVRLANVAAGAIDVEVTKGTTPTDKDGPYVFRSHDYAKMEKQAREFLKKYPHSHKREAAMFVLARSVQALSRPRVYPVGVLVEAGSKNNEGVYDSEIRVFRMEPFSAKRVLGPIEDYEHDFPNGRYASEIRCYHARAAWEMHDWGKALDLTLALLADNSKPDVQHEASVLLVNIYADLAEADCRADLIQAIKARPAAAAHLKIYLDKVPGSPSHPLRYLQAYLNDQLALTKK